MTRTLVSDMDHHDELRGFRGILFAATIGAIAYIGIQVLRWLT